MPGYRHARALPRRFRQHRSLGLDLRTRTTRSSSSASGLIETWDRVGFVRGLVEVAPARVFRARRRRRRPTKPSASSQPALKPLICSARLHSLMQRVRDEIDYVIGATSAHTTAAEALAKTEGRLPGPRPGLHLCGPRTRLPGPLRQRLLPRLAAAAVRGPARLGGGLRRGHRLGRIRRRQPSVPDRALRPPRLRASMRVRQRRCAAADRAASKEALDVVVEVQQQSSTQQ